MLVKVHRDPRFGFSSMFDLGGDFNQLIGRFLVGSDFHESRWSPPVDIVEDEKQYSVSVELPGVSKEDLKISVQDGLITLHAERKSATIPENAVPVRREISRGQFSRTLSVPEGVKVEEITAGLSNGILHIVLPKSEKARPREIEVK